MLGSQQKGCPSHLRRDSLSAPVRTQIFLLASVGCPAADADHSHHRLLSGCCLHLGARICIPR
eukprot:1069319-Pyramimonas_sp.AAC.1